MIVRLYCDEIKPIRNSDGQNWMYIGISAIPDTHYQSCLRDLLQDRNDAGYEREIKSTELTQRPKINLATRWVNRILDDREKRFHFYILGLNLDNLQRSAFGDSRSEQVRRIYNRFFRSSISFVLNSYFQDDSISVEYLFHDRTEMESDDLFDWHSLWRLQQDSDRVSFNRDRITFIDSDHEREISHPNDSHFIQLTDLILGCARQCLDCTSTRGGIMEVAQVFLPLAQRLADERRCDNPNSRFRYFRRCKFSFFPSARLSETDLEDAFERVRSSFFVNRALLLSEKVSGQGRLF